MTLPGKRLTLGICAEPGDLEMQAAMLVASLRACGGACADTKVVVISPRGRQLSPRARAFFDDYQCHVAVEDLNTEHRDDPLANKPYAAAWLASQTDQLWFLDSDTLVTDDLTPLLTALESDTSAILRPVWPGGFHNVGSFGPGDVNDGFWTAAYRLTKAKSEPYITVPWHENRIRGYWNSGVVVCRDSSVFLDWRDSYLVLSEHNLRPKRRAYMEQVAFAVAVAKAEQVISYWPGVNASLEQVATIRFGRLFIVHYAGPAPSKLSKLRGDQLRSKLQRSGLNEHRKGHPLILAIEAAQRAILGAADGSAPFSL
jgi:hypothetical protein